MADQPIHLLEELPGTGAVPKGTLFVVRDLARGKDFRVPYARLIIGFTGGSGGDSLFPEDEQPTATAVGNLPAGSEVAGRSIAEVLREAFSQAYQVPAFTSFLLGGAGSRTVEVGTSFPAGFKPFTWATNNPQNILPLSLSLRDVTGNSILAGNEANDGVLSASTAGFTAILGETRRFRLSATNSQGAALSADLVISGQYASYFVYSTNPDLSAAQIVALGGSQLQNGKARTVSGVTASGGSYVYYAYAASAGDLTNIVLNNALPVLGAFTKQGDGATANAQGASVTLRIYRSNATNAFVNNTLAFE